MPKKLVVLSFDALQTGDLELLSGLPWFSRILKKAAVVKNVREIYPTLTYPIHTTMITGVHPDRHGITHNQKARINPDDPDFSIMGSDWYWEKENIKVKTLTDAVWEQGGSVATVLWPVTAGEKRGYNLPEIWPVRGGGEDPKSVYEKAASDNVMSDYYGRFVGHYNWSDNEDMCYYGVEVALDLLKTQRPDLLLCHVVMLDHTRHLYGDQGNEVNDCLRELDIIAGRFVEAVREAGEWDSTNFVILGDHGQIDIETVFNINSVFKDMGLIRTDEKGKAVDYDAYSFSAGFSAQVFLNEPGDPQWVQKVYRVLEEIRRKYPRYLERIYTAEEAEAEEQLRGGFSFVLEGTEGTLFGNEVSVPAVISADSPLFQFHRAMHGHHPDKGDKPPFLAFGPDILPGVRLDSGNMIDVCPTFAKLARVDLPAMEGKPFPILKA
ncbi:alkaline phosphatase family protein [Caproicibacter fermentans]|uniref:Alkaline phosphatase family protein n=1 Tax=Caproicibacter fermentans TaxID=2576756 RepID=A0A7G8TBG0_9FIRM|nr:ectonucleotide pyrophosphatase/phosphodiesterase [Caproicibacter fermentans]QNK40951.1 alkaline phosphatase family protein [Caproicibacter fermentans]